MIMSLVLTLMHELLTIILHVQISDFEENKSYQSSDDCAANYEEEPKQKIQMEDEKSQGILCHICTVSMYVFSMYTVNY